MSIFGTDGIRDRAGEGLLKPASVERLGRAVALLLRRAPRAFRAGAGGPRLRRSAFGRGCVLIGRDTRGSGPEIEEALLRGLAAGGVETLRAGVIPTPGVAHLTRKWGCALGVVISASHNPAEDNGIKLISPDGWKVPAAVEEAIERAYRRARPGRARNALRAADVSERGREYGDDLLRAAGRPDLSGWKIVLDCAHGATASFAPGLVRACGARVTSLACAPDGRNINAGCGAIHPENLQRAAARRGADAGATFDGDGDRCLFVDAKGALRDGDDVLYLAARWLKARRRLRGNRVVSTVMANHGLERALAETGVTLVRTKVGDRYVAEEMARTGARVGGEPSGHILFLDRATTGDGMLTALTVWRMLGDAGGRWPAFPKATQVMRNVRVRSRPPLSTLSGVMASVRRAESALGRDGRVVLRYSGTEPLCRVMVEGMDAGLVPELAGEIERAVRGALAGDTRAR